MGLPLAVKLHSEGDLAGARAQYERALEQGQFKPILFQNYGALLRSIGEKDKALEIYAQGLEQYPGNIEITTNKANLLMYSAPAHALNLFLAIIRHRLVHDKSYKENKALTSALVSAVTILREMGCISWAIELIKLSSSIVGLNPPLMLNLMLLLDHSAPSEEPIAGVISDELFVELEKGMDSYSKVEQAEIRFGLAAHLISNFDVPSSIKQYNKALLCLANQDDFTEEDIERARKSYNMNAWNFSNSLIRKQEFVQGWKLYEFGLQTPAHGTQRWQRSLSKPFFRSEVELWNGCSLASKSLLLLEEQGIGDVMQFISLVPTLLNEASEIGLFVSERLKPVYRKSFSDYIVDGRLKVFSHLDAINGKLRSDVYDYQSPLGSIVQYRFDHPTKFHPKTPILKCDSHSRDLLRQQYLERFPNVKNIVGISWRGGGRGDRIKQKSLDLNDFIGFISGFEDTLFLSLQYGEDGTSVEIMKKHVKNVLYDPRFNALKDLDSWHNQVACCDGVLSVANTTVHGSGGLNIPTQCLLSNHADWRWLSDPSITRSYWYPSVGICRQDPATASWDSAKMSVRKWLGSNCPYPTGKYYN